MNLLSINTAIGNSCSMIINNQVIANTDSFADKDHLEKLHNNLDKLFKQAQINYDNLDIILVALGPGGFTSTRIGITVAKAINVVYRDIKIYGINIFDALYYTYVKSYKYTIVILHSIRDKYQYRVYDIHHSMISEICNVSLNEIIIKTQNIMNQSLYITPIKINNIQELVIYNNIDLKALFLAYKNNSYTSELKQLYLGCR